MASVCACAQAPAPPPEAHPPGIMNRAAEGVETSKATLETSETLFAILAAINSCGYDQELSSSDSLRTQVRAEVQQAVSASPEAKEALGQLCRFYRDHQQADSSRDLAQYISLALNLSDPPKFATSVKEADLPPDAAYVLGLAPLLENFYAAAGLNSIWGKHQSEYEAQIERFNQPVAGVLQHTDFYLKLPISGYLGRRFVVVIEPMGAPGQENARNYGTDYFIVVTPSRGRLKLESIRHAYLHYVLDPLSLKRGNSFKRLEPLLESVATAHIDESYKRDISLLVTESLIRAIEARLWNEQKGKRDSKAQEALEKQRREKVQQSVNEGFILTRYFYDALDKFERDLAGVRETYLDWLYQIDVGDEKKRAAQLTFTSSSAPDPLAASKRKEPKLVDLAERRMEARDFAGAQQVAHQALEKDEQPARALFVLARAASQLGDMQGARIYFERTLEVAKDARILSWSHIYLGRIFDLRKERPAALAQYRAALATGDMAPDTRSAAERGLRQPYEPPPQARQAKPPDESSQP